AFAQERYALQALDLVVLRHPEGGQHRLRQYPFQVCVRVHHPVLELHACLPRDRARTFLVEYPFSWHGTACIQPGTLTPAGGSSTVSTGDSPICWWRWRCCRW